MVYHDNILCISYGELTDGNPDSPEEAQRPVLSTAMYKYMLNKGNIEQVRRGCFGQSALVAYRSLPERYKERVVAKYGDPERLATQSSLRDMVQRDMRAEDFYRRYTTDGYTHLKEEIQRLYVANASVMNAILDLMSKRIATVRLGGGNSGRVLREISEELNSIQPELGCKLPKNAQALKRVIDRYKAEGYAALISKKHKNDNTSKVKTKEQQALMTELTGDGRNLNNETIARLYNAVAAKMGWKVITAGTVGNFKKNHPETFAGRHGAKALRNEKAMQVSRFTPTCPMYFWTSDGWDVELFYQRTYRNTDGRKVTTYHNRPTVVFVVDPYNYYIVGYAVGTQETPELIRAAFRNAFEHICELFGDYYRPHQIQTDNYGKGNLTPFYQSLTAYYTPAAVGNAKSKPIEPFFKRINDEYFRLLPNSSGYGVKSRQKLQVSDNWIELHKKEFPDYEGCVRQIEEGIAYFRSQNEAQYVKAWQQMPDDKRLPFPRIDWLAAFGEVASPRKLRPNGILLQIDKQVYQYDCFDPEFRNYGHRSFFLRYDPNDLTEVLAIENVGTEKNPEEGGVQFLLQEKYKQPMAFMDRREGDFEQWQKVQAFNRQMEADIIRKRKESAETLRSFFEENEERLRDTLTAHVITDSLGQHKDRRNLGRGKPTLELPTVSDESPTEISKSPTEIPKTVGVLGQDEEYMVEINENDFLNDF